MDSDLGVRLEEARKQLTARDELQKERVRTEHELREDIFRRDQLDTCLELLDSEILKLESPKWLGIFQSFLGDSRNKIARKEQDRNAIQRQRDRANVAVEKNERRLAEIDGQLDGLADAGARYEALLRTGERCTVAEGTENTQ